MKKSPLLGKNAAATGKTSYAKDDLVKLLQKYFGHSEFRGKQLHAIEAVLSGRDCFCLMPTGGGKSMCYQIPALTKSGIVLVVCPLIALMENQVMSLKEKKIAVEYLSSTQKPPVREKIYEDLDSAKPTLKLLYVTPELIATAGFMPKLKKVYNRGLLNLIAIDEAHCVSTWGHDFRPSYRKLSSLRNHLPSVPILALTATAVPKVQKDVIELLCLENPVVLRSSFNRPNIFYEVRYKDLLEDTKDDLLKLLKASGNVCSIIYCLERASCDDLSAHLVKSGISCAGLNSKMRSTILDDWLSSKTQGIDRKDVRLVCHFNIPKSMEAFYQESGRAGRDQMPSRSLLYYGIDDHKRMEFILSNTNNKKSQSPGSHGGLSKKSLADFNQVRYILPQMVEYCEGSGCRRKKILDSFGEQVTASLCRKSCDACKDPNLVAKHLSELSLVSSLHKRNRSVFISSSSDKVAEGHFTEFWNRDDEASASEEDISDADDFLFKLSPIEYKGIRTILVRIDRDEDGLELMSNLSRSNFSSKSGVNEKIDALQRAEERYYKDKAHDINKKDSGINNRVISEALRQASRQRLLDALKKAQQRLGNSGIELEASAYLLENECFKKYGKVGKTFYNSQMASTVRWLSTSSSQDITDRLGTSDNQNSGSCNSSAIPPESSVSLANSKDQVAGPIETSTKGSHGNFASETSSNVAPTTPPMEHIKLPPIPFFSEFVCRKADDNGSKRSSKEGIRNEKRRKLQ
ncbi:hypothetical protein Sjap_011918 [Stephania japonica]|uniref:ATP-dependent DNA helicase n=1 Tax=Stephania japonica TaxID=461633 RepID=A0AAP0JE12_9MAGN